MTGVGENNDEICRRVCDVLKQTDKEYDHIDNPKYLQKRLHEQRNLLEQAILCLKKSEDANMAMERRQNILLSDNDALKDKLAVEKHKCLNLRHKLKVIQLNYDKFNKMKEDYQEMCKVVQGGEKPGRETKEKSTSSTNLVKMTNKCEQAWVDCPKCENNKGKETSVRLTRSDLDRLEEDMQALKAVLQQRECTWSKVAERERLQRMQAARLNTELNNLRQVATSRQGELQLKTEAMNELNKQLERQHQENARLKKQLVKLERREKECPILSDLDMEVFMQKLCQSPLEEPVTHCARKKSARAKSCCSSNLTS